MNETLALLVGLLARLGLPLVIMAVLIIFLRRLDERWQREAPTALALYHPEQGSGPVGSKKVVRSKP